MIRARLAATFAVSLALVCGSCSASSGSSANAIGADAGTRDGVADGALALSAPCNDTIASVYGDAEIGAGERGDIVRCAAGTTLTRDAIRAGFVTGNATARAPVSGAIEYRILYRTERATNPASPGYATASVFLPDRPHAGPLPVITLAHGTAGVAPSCAPSKVRYLDPNNDHFAMAFTLVARGFAVIATDYAGYAGSEKAGNARAGYLFAEDEAKSVLDAARALRKLAPTAFSDAVVVVGFSQGGHAALSALAASDSYGTGGRLAGVVAYSPLWFNMGTWGALFIEASSFPLADPGSLSAIKYDIWYHYTHGEILDGAGHGLDVFASDKRDAIRAFIDGACDPGDAPMISSLAGDIHDLYDPSFVLAVKQAEAFGLDCPADPALNAICERWKPRYAADRPRITGGAAKVPTLIVRGGADTSIPTDRFVCGTERLHADAANTSVCVEPTADHGGTIRMRGDWVADWIANVALGEPAPPPCAFGASALVDDAGAAVGCNSPPPND